MSAERRVQSAECRNLLPQAEASRKVCQETQLQLQLTGTAGCSVWGESLCHHIQHSTQSHLCILLLCCFRLVLVLLLPAWLAGPPAATNTTSTTATSSCSGC